MKCLVRSLCSFLVLMILVQISLTLSNKSNLKTKSEIEQQYDSIWKTLFSGTRGQSCAGQSLLKSVLASAKAKAEQTVNGKRAKSGKFAWVKNWGYGKLAYLLDFMDPAVRKDILKEFNKIYNDMKELPRLDTAEYKDPFDLKKLLANADAKMSEKAMKDFKLINKNYDPKIYDISINAVQLRQAMIDWKWAINFEKSDFAKFFIQRYDMNGDGRLNPRELILGALDNNKHLFGSNTCTHCFEEVTKKIEAIFTYIDCDNDGKVTAEDMWNNLPKLKRDGPQYNMFALGSRAGIRTASVNDFVLMNGKHTKGILNKTEFRNGVLFGVWDRQTDFTKIIEGEERTLKDLRWKDDDMVDIKAEEYITDVLVEKMRREKNKL